MDLVSQQNASQRLRNPFGFDFHAMYDGKPYTIPGDGQWYTLVGGLADHAITHLASKVLNQYHDEQTAQLRSQGRVEEATKYQPGVEVENMIYKLITGENMPTVSESQINVEAADLDALTSAMSKVTAQAATSGTPRISITDIVSQAQQEALAGQTSGGFVAPQAPQIQAAAAIEPVVTPAAPVEQPTETVPDFSDLAQTDANLAPEAQPDQPASDQPEAPAFADLAQ